MLLEIGVSYTYQSPLNAARMLPVCFSESVFLISPSTQTCFGALGATADFLGDDIFFGDPDEIHELVTLPLLETLDLASEINSMLVRLIDWIETRVVFCDMPTTCFQDATVTIIRL